MQFVKGGNRLQNYISTLNEHVSVDNSVRLIDAFVDMPNLQKPGFAKTVHKSEGRPQFAPEVLFKLYLFGYLNKILCSHKLARTQPQHVIIMTFETAAPQLPYHRQL